MIRATVLEKTYAGAAQATLRGLSFEVPKGALAALLGRSGSGKSTLLRCLVGLEPFDRGVVEVNGVQLVGADQRPSPRQRARAVAGVRSHMGLVFQSFELFPHLTVLQNCVLAPVKVKRQSPTEAAERAMALLDQVGLAEKAGAYPEHLSGGQRQRVAIARALAMQPSVLLYDEPTSALDPAYKHEVVQAMREVGRTGVTQVVVTHDVQLARSSADLVFVLDCGEVVESGHPADVLDAPRHDATRSILTVPM